MTRIVVAGAAGRMGRMIVATAEEHADARVTGALERAGSPLLGEDSGVLAGISANGVPVTDAAEALLDDADVLVDFTVAEAVVRHAELCARKGVGMVIGTTGLDADQKTAVRQAARKVPVVMAPNMSVGVNVLLDVLRKMAGVLGDDYDIEIVEAHHRMKNDAPSGTALRMLEVLAEARELAVGESAVYGRRGLVGPRPTAEIGVHAVRGGDIVGDHTVLFAGPGERIEITHRAHSRQTLARGAVRAALWLLGRKPGLYDMADVLGLA